MIADECNLAATGNKKRKLFIKTKKLFSRDEKMIFIPKSIKAWIRYVCIHTNSIGLLKHIQKIRQYYIGARNKIVIKDTMYKYKFS